MWDAAPSSDAPRAAREAWVLAMARRTLSDCPESRLTADYGHSGASVVGMMVRHKKPLPLDLRACESLAEKALEEARAALE